MYDRIAVNGLRDRFPGASVRLLSDLVDLALLTGEGERREMHERGDEVEAAIVVALDRPLRVAPLRPGRSPALLAPGAVYHYGERGFETGPVRVTPLVGQPAHCLVLRTGAVSRALAASSTLSRGLAPGRARSAAEITQVVWVCKRPEVRAPLEPLTHLLASAVSRQFREPTAILLLNEPGHELLVFERDGFHALDVRLPAGRFRVEPIVEALDLHRPSLFYHLFVVRPERPADLPETFAGFRFHRIVYVTDAVPPEVPPGLDCRLRATSPEAGGKRPPYFCSFIPSVVPGGPASRGPSSEPIVDAGAGNGRDTRGGAARALARDACRIFFDLEDLTVRWERAKAAGGRLSFVAETSPRVEEIAGRWARAVTNRQVGLALSGGGATSYRIVPLIRMLHDRHVPIDVVSGVSGGALIGAYYCKDGLRGLDTCVARGGALQAGIFAAVAWAELIELQLMLDLGLTRVEDTDVRFVPITTALRNGSPPEAHAVVRGRLCRAVRLSGSAPVAFAPTHENGIRYTDGATATPVPARAVREYGADIVFACNSVPGPARGNPLGDGRLGRFLHDYTLLGRAIDLWVSAAFLLQEISREVCADADVFFAPQPADVPFFECFRFADARRIVSASASSAGLHAAVAQCEERWRRFASRCPAMP